MQNLIKATYKKSFLTVFGILLVTGCATIPERTTVYDLVYTPQQLQFDLAFVDQQLRDIHPNLFSRLTEKEYQQSLAALNEAIVTESNRRSFFTQIAPLLASFKDTHIQLQLPVKEFREFSTRQGLFPLKILISEGEFIVLADEQDLPTIPVGAEITAINAIPVNELIPRLGELVPSETDTGRVRLIQIHLAKLLWAVFPNDNSYTINYNWRGREFSEQLSPELPNVTEVQPTDSAVKNVSNYGTRELAKDTSMLWLNDFNEDNAVFEEFLENYFNRLREQGTANLVIDLRYNQGGLTDNLKLLLSYLSSQPINWAEKARLKVSEEFKRTHKQLVRTTKSDKYSAYLGWLPMEYLNLWQWELLFSSEGEVLETDIDPLIENQEMYFQGNIVVLSNGYCFSACAALLSNLQTHNLATIMGESPGSFVGRQFGYPIQIQLPNTGLLLSLPAMEIILHDDVGTTKLLQPDVAIARARQDVIDDRDIILKSALDFLNAKEMQ